MHDVQVLRAACCIAAADGEVDEREMHFLQHLREKAGVGAKSFEAMIEMARSDPRFYEQQFDIILRDKEETIRTLFEVAAADGDVSANERTVLQYFAQKIGLPDDEYDRIVERRS